MAGGSIQGANHQKFPATQQLAACPAAQAIQRGLRQAAVEDGEQEQPLQDMKPQPGRWETLPRTPATRSLRVSAAPERKANLSKSRGMSDPSDDSFSKDLSGGQQDHGGGAGEARGRSKPPHAKEGAAAPQLAACLPAPAAPRAHRKGNLPLRGEFTSVVICLLGPSKTKYVRCFQTVHFWHFSKCLSIFFLHAKLRSLNQWVVCFKEVASFPLARFFSCYLTIRERKQGSNSEWILQKSNLLITK